MARIIAGVATSHIPAIGAAWDNGKTGEPYWRPVFAGFERSKEWIAKLKPDVCIVGLQRSRVGLFARYRADLRARLRGANFPIADEGWGPRPVPPVKGHPELAWHIVQSVVLDEFDITIVNKMDVDHGLTVPLSLMFGQPKEWPCPIVPALRQCRGLSRADRPSLLHAGQGDPQGGRILRSGFARRHLRHRRHVASIAGSARRTDQQGIRQTLPRQSHARSRRRWCASRISNICARRGRKASKW